MLYYFPRKNLIKWESIFCGCYLPEYTLRFFSYRSVRKLQLLSTGSNPPGNVTATWASASNADCLGLSSKQNVLEKKEKDKNQPQCVAVHNPSVDSYCQMPAAKTLKQMCSVLHHQFIVLKHRL